ncbi:four helix bundle protein [Candidatus Bipolaricaulota bacterium]|nr:four helix bundle protein [Candidatus Bipolaricaulota bacterium]
MDYEDLDVWNKAHKLTLKIYEMTEKFPSEEQYRLKHYRDRNLRPTPPKPKT